AVAGDQTGLAVRARRAGAAAVDVGLARVLDRIVAARRRLASAARAHPAQAVARHAAVLAGRAPGTGAAAAVDVALASVFDLVVARRAEVRRRRGVVSDREVV